MNDLLYRLHEVSINLLRSKVDSKRVIRSKGIKSYLISVNKSGTIIFKSTAVTTPGVKYWVQKIRPVKSLKRNMSLKQIRNIFNGDVIVTCSCPDFGYGGFRYIATLRKYNYGYKETRYPEIRNPRLKGSVCKHVASALRVLKANLPSVVSKLHKLYSTNESISEEFLDYVSVLDKYTKKVSNVPIYKNPTPSEYRELFNEDENKHVRIGIGDNVYAWPASVATHDQMSRHLNKKFMFTGDINKVGSVGIFVSSDRLSKINIFIKDILIDLKSKIGVNKLNIIDSDVKSMHI